MSSLATLTSADPGWDDARAAFDRTVDLRPAAIADAQGERAVLDALRLAEQRDLRVAVQGTSHGASGLPALDGTLLLRVGALDEIAVDPHQRTVTFGAGARARDVVAAAAAHGLAVPAGFAPTVGLTGYALGGGIGWFARRRGLAAHQIAAVELATADGAVRRVDAEHDPELLWALRGGGAGLGVVLRTTLALEPLSAVHGGALFWPAEQAPAVFERWTAWCDELPDDVTSVARFLALPPLPEIPEPLRGRSWCVVESVHATDPAEHERLLEPLRALRPAIDTYAPLPLTALGRLHGDPEQPLPVAGEHLLLDPLDGDALDALVELAGAGSGSPLVSVDLRQLGGALARATDDDGPLGAIDAAFALHAIGVVPDAAAEAAVEDRLASLRAALAPWDTTRVLANFCERPTPAERIHRPAALQRLCSVARRMDPAGRFLTALDLEAAPCAA